MLKTTMADSRRSKIPRKKGSQRRMLMVAAARLGPRRATTYDIELMYPKYEALDDCALSTRETLAHGFIKTLRVEEASYRKM